MSGEEYPDPEWTDGDWTEKCGEALLEQTDKYIQEGCIDYAQAAVMFCRLAEHYVAMIEAVSYTHLTQPTILHV